MTPRDLEQLIRRDPAARGLLCSDGAAGLCLGHLAAAATDLAQRAAVVGIVTGFFVPDADPPAAETDGLAGSVLLADTLRTQGIDAFLITDEPCAAALSTSLRTAGLSRSDLLVCPIETACATAWMDEFRLSSRGRKLTHLIAVERPAPGYSAQTLAAQSWSDAEVVEEFTSTVPAASRGRCHNMRGRDVDETAAALYLLFEDRPHAAVRTIGIGDGGNEIGMGGIPWQTRTSAIARPEAARIASRTATDWTILAGVSDWGAFALAAAVSMHRGELQPLAAWTADRIERLLQAAVTGGPAVDGITRRAEPTVDGLPLITYLQPWLHIRGRLGLDVA